MKKEKGPHWRWIKKGQARLLGIEFGRAYLWDEPMGWGFRVGILVGEMSWWFTGKSAPLDIFDTEE